ncbi:hypothetical protein OAE84_01110 [bacterium]|nr:hypothetical protein [bacterium]
MHVKLLPAAVFAILATLMPGQEAHAGTRLLDDIPQGGSSNWTNTSIAGMNPVVTIEEVPSPDDGSTALRVSALGTSLDCESRGAERTFNVPGGNTTDSKLYAYLAFAFNGTYYNFPAFIVDALDSQGDSVGGHLWFGQGIIGGYHLNLFNSGNYDYIQLPTAEGQFEMDLEALGDNLDFEALRVTILTYTCIGTNSVVLDNLVLEGTFCGNGVIDEAEACDDGNNTDGDCCSSTCEIEPAGTLCGPVADICDLEDVCNGASPTCPDERRPDSDTDGTCDLYDICPDDADPSQADTDEDGLGDACDPCTGGILAYKPLLKATNFATAAGDDKLKYKAKLIFDDAVSISPQTQGFRLLVEDAGGDVLIDLDIPAGLYDPIDRSGWIPTPNGKKFQYITKTPVDGMLPKVILKWNPKKANEVLVIVKGKSGDFADPNVTLPLKATVSLDPTDAMTSLCAEAEFPGPKPLPYCRMSGNGVAVTCK